MLKKFVSILKIDNLGTIGATKLKVNLQIDNLEIVGATKLKVKLLHSSDFSNLQKKSPILGL